MPICFPHPGPTTKRTALALLVGCLFAVGLAAPALAANHRHEKTDDWSFEEAYAKVHHGRQPTGGRAAPANGPACGMPPPMALLAVKAPVARAGRLGLAVGGAKDIDNFRENIAKGKLPLPTDVTYEGLFYDYAFKTDGKCPAGTLFCPTYTTAVSDDPFTKKPEDYLAVSLGSGIKAADFRRRKLNLMLVLDISGSMSAPFDTYYYDQFRDGPPPKAREGDSRLSKLDAAKESLIALLDQLRPEDRFGLVLFDQFAYTALVPRSVASRDMTAIKKHIRALRPMGGTNLDAGLALATSLMQEARSSDPEAVENRVIFMTDAMPNLGSTSDKAFLQRIRDNAADRLSSTLIGIGLDFNTAFVEKILKARGANYYSVHSPADFRRRLGAEFDDMVTPLVFDLALRFDSKGYRIDKVFGSPEADLSTGELLRVATLFPSPTTAAGTRGGIVLLRLAKIGDDPGITLTATYEDRAGEKHTTTRNLDFPTGTTPVYGSPAIRKAILLARYAGLLRAWLTSAQRAAAPSSPEIPQKFGPPRLTPPKLGQWERQSKHLVIDPATRARFAVFRDAFRREFPACDDAGLIRELDVLDKLAKPDFDN